jgi:phenylalanyl-tRNA synthetase beta chain
MKVPYSELSRYVPVSDIEPEELVQRLNTHSVEADLEFFGNPDVEKVVVGKVLKTEPHPSLKKLLVCKVDVGKETLTVCTNDKTVSQGDKVFVVLPGGKIGDFEITERDFKGITSRGMFLGLEELVGVPSEGVFKFHDPSVKEGEDAKKLLGLGEPLIVLDITPNRGDLLSVKGLAREIATLYNLPLKLPQAPDFKPFGKGVEVSVEDTRGCRRYRAAVIRGVKVKESPLKLMAALWKFGEAVINNVVDITNYLLFTEGNPMHAFDLSRIKGKITVRRAVEGEKFKALNGKEYTLSHEDIVIADEEKVLALAGVIGGADSAVSGETEEVLLETAYFDPFAVRASSKRHDIRTESSYRFERNVDIENVARAQNMAIKMIGELAGGKLAALTDVYPEPYSPPTVSLSWKKYLSYTGAETDPREAARILNNLGLPTALKVENLSENGLRKVLIRLIAGRKGCKDYVCVEAEEGMITVRCSDGNTLIVDINEGINFLKGFLKEKGINL